MLHLPPQYLRETSQEYGFMPCIVTRFLKMGFASEVDRHKITIHPRRILQKEVVAMVCIIFRPQRHGTNRTTSGDKPV